jgi:hypothetical protein
MVIKNAKQQVLDPNCLLTNREGRHNGCSTSEKKKKKKRKEGVSSQFLMNSNPLYLAVLGGIRVQTLEFVDRYSN